MGCFYDPNQYDSLKRYTPTDEFGQRKCPVLEKFYGRDAYDAFFDVYASQTALA